MSFFIDRPFVRGTQGHRRRPFIGGLSFGDRRGRPGAGRGAGRPRVESANRGQVRGFRTRIRG